MYNRIPAVVQVEEHQGPDSVIQTNTKQMLKCAVPEQIQYLHLGRWKLFQRGWESEKQKQNLKESVMLN